MGGCMGQEFRYLFHSTHFGHERAHSSFYRGSLHTVDIVYNFGGSSCRFMEEEGRKNLTNGRESAEDDSGFIPGTQFLKHLALPSSLCIRSTCALHLAFDGHKSFLCEKSDLWNFTQAMPFRVWLPVQTTSTYGPAVMMVP